MDEGALKRKATDLELPESREHKKAKVTHESSAADQAQAEMNQAELKGVRVGILVEFNVEDTELTYPLYRLREEGCTTFTIGAKKGNEYKGKHGYPIKAEKGYDEVKESDLDVLIIPGGWAPDYWRRNPTLLALTAECVNGGRVVVASICHGPWLLVSAKVLKGRRITCFMAIKDDVINAGAEYVDQAVVQDGNLITSRCPDDLPIFCKTIITYLKGKGKKDAGAK